MPDPPICPREAINLLHEIERFGVGIAAIAGYLMVTWVHERFIIIPRLERELRLLMALRKKESDT